MKMEASFESMALPKEESSLHRAKFCGRIYDSWEALPAESGSFFQNASAESIFLSPAWFRNLAQNSMNSGQRLTIFSVEDSARPGVPALVMPAYAERSGLFRSRTLSSLTNFYTPLFAPLISPGCECSGLLQALAERVANESPRWDIVNLRWLDKGSEMFEELVSVFKRAGFVVQTYFCAGNWYEPIAGRDYGAYLGGLRSSVRNIARSKAKKIERSGRARIDIVTGGDALEPAIRAYQKIYSSSWKTPEPYLEFLPGLLRSFAEAGWLRLGIAYVDEEPAAAQVWFQANGVASIYKIAYDQKFKDLSVGSYLTMHMMRHVIDVEKVTEIDYLTGDDRYKKDWMSQRRERWGILAMNPRTPKGLAAIARHVGGRAAKRAVKRVVSQLLPRVPRKETAPVSAATVQPNQDKKD